VANIATIGLDGNQIRLVNPTFENYTPFSWSSDGTRIVFSDDYQISIMNIAGGEPLVLLTQGASEFEPVFAPQ
jgi:Tol biopolymer transport system component